MYTQRMYVRGRQLITQVFKPEKTKIKDSLET